MCASCARSVLQRLTCPADGTPFGKDLSKFRCEECGHTIFKLLCSECGFPILDNREKTLEITEYYCDYPRVRRTNAVYQVHKYCYRAAKRNRERDAAQQKLDVKQKIQEAKEYHRKERAEQFAGCVVLIVLVVLAIIALELQR